MRPLAASALLILPLALLSCAAPAQAAPPSAGPVVQCVLTDPDCGGLPTGNPVGCLVQPIFPETFAYYIVWHCSAGGVAPEPIDTATGCKGVFNQLRCDGGGLAGHVLRSVQDCLRDCIVFVPPCSLGPC